MAAAVREVVALFTFSKDEGVRRRAQGDLRALALEHHFRVVGFVAIHSRTPTVWVAQLLRLLAKNPGTGLLCRVVGDVAMNPIVLHEFLVALSKQESFLYLGDAHLELSCESLGAIATLLATALGVQVLERSQAIKKALARKKRVQPLGGVAFGQTEDERKLIGKICRLHNDGMSLQKICDFLSENNIDTVRHKKWYPTTVKRIIERIRT